MIYNVANQKYTINKQVKEDIETLKNNDEVFKEDIATVTVALNNKVDKQTEGGGFIAGEILLTEDNKAYTGVSIGKNAKTYGGVNIGKEAYGSVGAVAIGDKARSTMGASIGDNSHSNSGGAVGYEAYTTSGGAIGYRAKAGKGFSGGAQATVAETGNNSEKYIDAIQLGKGTNSIPKTLQVYDYQLLDANGKIPNERFEITGQIGDTITTARKIRKINDTEWLPCDGREILKEDYPQGYKLMPNILLDYTDNIDNSINFTNKLISNGEIVCTHNGAWRLYVSQDNMQAWESIDLEEILPTAIQNIYYSNGYWIIVCKPQFYSDASNQIFVYLTEDILNPDWKIVNFRISTGAGYENIHTLLYDNNYIYILIHQKKPYQSYYYGNIWKINIDTNEKIVILDGAYTINNITSPLYLMNNSLYYLADYYNDDTDTWNCYSIGINLNNNKFYKRELPNDISQYHNLVYNGSNYFISSHNSNVVYYTANLLNNSAIKDFYITHNIYHHIYIKESKEHIFIDNNWDNSTRESCGSIITLGDFGAGYYIGSNKSIYGQGEGNNKDPYCLELNDNIWIYSYDSSKNNISKLTKCLPQVPNNPVGLQTYIRVK